MAVVVKTPHEIALMREAGKIVAATLEMLAEKVRPGLPTSELDKAVMRFLKERHAQPSFKGYRGFPASVCVSVNDQVVHGIPGAWTLNEGDIVSLDVGAIYKGYHGDAAITVPVGEVGEQARSLIQVTQNALLAGIGAAKEGARLGDISWAVQLYVESRGFSVVREYVGHGIGRQMHEDPQVPNFGQPGSGPLLRKGMTLALEPMVNAGDWRTRVLADHWTVVTADRSLSAHFEHTVAIAGDEAEILTAL